MRFFLEKLIITIVVIAVSAFLFLYVNEVNADLMARGQAFTGLETWLDAYIPFIPQFIWFYCLYYVWVLLVTPIMAEREHFYHAAASFAVLQTAAIATFILFPSYMVRPQVIGNSISHDMVRWMYNADHGFNLIPSLHVGHSTLVTLFYRAHKPKVFPVVAAGTFMIALSTVIIKQHYIVDIPVGFLMALGAYYVTAPVVQLVQPQPRES